MSVRSDIEQFAKEPTKSALLWLLTKYHWQSQWYFVATWKPVKYGPLSYQIHRHWTPTEEGWILYNHYLKTATETSLCPTCSTTPAV